MLIDAAQDAEACRRLWLAVAEAAVADAAKEVVDRKKQKRPKKLERAVAEQMVYFNSRSWRNVCEFAGISYTPEKIREMLMSEKANRSATLMRRGYGLTEWEC